MSFRDHYKEWADVNDDNINVQALNAAISALENQAQAEKKNENRNP